MAFTRHGHHIPGTIRDKYTPPVARCGGPPRCSDCAIDAAGTEMSTMQEGYEPPSGSLNPPRPVRMPLQEELTATQETMYKVYDALKGSGLTRPQALEAINQMQNAGILFREAKEDLP